MGGFGSGRPAQRRRQKAEGLRCVDVNRLSREGCLKPGFVGAMEWRENGNVVSAIALCMRDDELVLDYKIRHNEGPWKSVRQHSPIEWTQCRYGGRRPWFSCPGKKEGVVCGRRVARLFAGGDYFLCRHCYSVVYASQSEDRLGRAQRRAQKRSRQLQGASQPDVTGRPPRLWRRTRERLVERSVAAEVEADDLLQDAMMRIFGRIERRSERLKSRREDL